jgi:hypothetical protein
MLWIQGQQAGVPSAADFDRKLAETDAYLQLLINQVESLEKRIEACEDVAEKEKYNVIKVTANAMIEAIKHSIVMLQISKVILSGIFLKNLCVPVYEVLGGCGQKLA